SKLKSEAASTVPLLLACQAERFSAYTIGGQNVGMSLYVDEPFRALAMIAPKDKRFASAVLGRMDTRKVDCDVWVRPYGHEVGGLGKRRPSCPATEGRPCCPGTRSRTPTGTGSRTCCPASRGSTAASPGTTGGSST